MRVQIKYCRPCGYRRHAERLAKKIAEQMDATCELLPGNFGVFKIWSDGDLIFDKRTTRGWLGKIGFGRIPADDVLLKMLKKSMSFPTEP